MAGQPLSPDCRATVTIGGTPGRLRVKKVEISHPDRPGPLILDPSTFPNTYPDEIRVVKDVTDTLGSIAGYSWPKDLDGQ